MSDELLEKIYNKVEKIAEDVGELKITSAVHEETLRVHVKRSDTLEALYIDLQEKEIEPIKKDINQIKGGYKLIMLLGTIITVVMGILKLLSKI